MEPMEASKTSGFSVFELKELYIEYALRSAPQYCMVYNLPISSLENMMILDTDELEAHNNTSLFTRISASFDLLDTREDERLAFLRTLFLSLEPAVKVQMNQAFEEELKALGLVESLGSKVALTKRALEIARVRVLAKYSRDGNTQLDTEMKYDFKVLLSRLCGGYGSSMDTVYLYFDYKTELWSFLESLQEMTRFSTIPPVNLEKQNDDEEKIDLSRSMSSWLSEPSAIASSASQIPTNTQLEPSVVLPGESIASTDLAQNSTPHPAKGYTLELGPWLWRIKRNDPAVKKKDPWHMITGLGSYNKMLNSVKVESTNNGEKPVTIAVIHSLDKGAVDQWYNIQRNDRQEERDFQQAMWEQGFDDEEIGEPYMQSWLAGQNTEGGSGHSSSSREISNIVVGSHLSPSQRTRSDSAENGA